MKEKKMIWCISKYASPPNYGVGARLFYVAREFCKIGFDVLLISSDSNHLAKYPESDKIYNLENYENLLYMWIKTYKYTRNASLKRFISWIDFEIKLFRLNRSNYKKPDVVIISSLSLLSVIYGIFLKKKYDCKLIFEVRDIHPLILTDEFGVSKWNPMVLFLGMIEKIGYSKSDLIVGTMPNLKQHVKEILGKEKEVFHSPIGVHEIWYKEQIQSALVDSLFPLDNQFVVGYAGSMGVSNAMDMYMEVIEKMTKDKEVFFILVGDGDLKQSFIERLSGLNKMKSHIF